MARAATEGRPYQLVNPRSLSPVLLMCEHAANRLPVKAGGGRALRAVLESHWGWDIGGWRLTCDLARRLGCTAIGGRWSRLWIDLNRRADDPTLIRRKAGRVVLPWNDGIDAATVERRMLACHVPYHVEVDRLILKRLVRGVRPVLLAVHTFTPRFDGGHRPFEIGILYEHHLALARRLAGALRRSGFGVRYNQPYSGMKGMMYSVDRHGTHHRLPCLELEVNQRLFKRPRDATRLGAAIEPAVRALYEAGGD